MTASFKRSPGVVLIVDPAVRSAEAEAYNNMLALIDELKEYEGIQPLSLRFWLPVRGTHASLEHFLLAHPEVMERLVGCVSLGSAANVTDEADHPWMADYEKLLFDLVKKAGVPFLGICFAHQFLAQRQGAKVGYAAAPELAGMRYHAEGRRQLFVTARKVRLLLSDVPVSEWNRQTCRAQNLHLSLRALASGDLTEEKLEKPLSPAERAARSLSDESPKIFDAWARHWQVVRQIHRDPVRPSATEFIPSLVSSDHPFDGLVHRSLPWFTLQTHPERPLTQISRLFLKNFLLLCSVGRGIAV